jgi:glycosyltransferase involved in cell wall biosynthesis
VKKPTIIGIDTRDLRLATTGTKTYLEELIKALKKNPSKEFILVEYKSFWPPYWGHNLLGKLYEHLSFLIWKQVTLPIKTFFSGADVLLCTDYYLPLLKLKAKHMVVFHDALFFDHPEYYNPLWLKWFKLIAISASKKADSIVVPSQFSLNRLSEFLPSLKDKMQVIYQGPKSTPPQSGLSLNTRNAINKIGNTPYILHVGGLEKRKNLPFLIHALKKIRETIDVKLLLVGRPNPKIYNNSHEEIVKTIATLLLQEEVIFTGYVPDEDLPYLYQHALVYALPSTYEGFGIPILEAFQNKVPVVVADNTCLPEIGGDAVLSFSPDDELALATSMLEVIGNKDMRDDLIKKGSERLKKFSWDESAKDFLAAAIESINPQTSH